MHDINSYMIAKTHGDIATMHGIFDSDYFPEADHADYAVFVSDKFRYHVENLNRETMLSSNPMDKITNAHFVNMQNNIDAFLPHIFEEIDGKVTTLVWLLSIAKPALDPCNEEDAGRIDSMCIKWAKALAAVV